MEEEGGGVSLPKTAFLRMFRCFKCNFVVFADVEDTYRRRLGHNKDFYLIQEEIKTKFYIFFILFTLV